MFESIKGPYRHVCSELRLRGTVQTCGRIDPRRLGRGVTKVDGSRTPKKMDLPILQGPKESRNCVYGSPKGPKIGGLTWINQWESQK